MNRLSFIPEQMYNAYIAAKSAKKSVKISFTPTSEEEEVSEVIGT